MVLKAVGPAGVVRGGSAGPPDFPQHDQLAGRHGRFRLGRPIVLGARVPIALTSRADSVEARVVSLALAALLTDHQRRRAAGV